MSLFNIGIPFDYVACGMLSRANTKNPLKEDVLGVNIQNIFGQIPFYNFFVSVGRIKKSVEHIKEFGNSKYLSSSDKSEMTKCYLHIGRGIVEFIPVAGLLFLVPDILYSIVKLAINHMKEKKATIQDDLNDLNEIVKSLKRNYLRFQRENKVQDKKDVKNLIIAYMKKVKACEDKIQLESQDQKYNTERLNRIKDDGKFDKKSIPSYTDSESIEVCAEKFLQEISHKEESE